LFEGSGPPPTAFHGGFGLMSRDGIRKPAWFAYKYLHELGDTELKTGDTQSFTTRQGDAIQCLIWDFYQPVQDKSNRPFYSKLVPTAIGNTVVLGVKHMKPGSYSLTLRRTGFRANDAFSAYIDMGSPKDLTAGQLAQLTALTTDTPQVSIPIIVGRAGIATTRLPMRLNDIVLVKIESK